MRCSAALPHGTTQEIIAAVLKANPAIKVLDMSADFRLRDRDTYAQWYGHEHRALGTSGRGGLWADRVLSRKDRGGAAGRLSRLLSDGGAACAGAAGEGRADRCRTTSSSTPNPASPAAGRGLKQNTLFSKRARGCRLIRSARIAMRRRSSRRSALPRVTAVTVNFTPHLIPMARGELCTCYVRLDGATPDDLRARAGEGLSPTSRSCMSRKRACCRRPRTCAARITCRSASFADRIKGRGHRDLDARQSGEGFGRAGDPEHEPDVRLPETAGLEQIALFP